MLKLWPLHRGTCHTEWTCTKVCLACQVSKPLLLHTHRSFVQSPSRPSSLSNFAIKLTSQGDLKTTHLSISSLANSMKSQTQMVSSYSLTIPLEPPSQPSLLQLPSLESSRCLKGTSSCCESNANWVLTFQTLDPACRKSPSIHRACINQRGPQAQSSTVQ